MMSAMNNRPNHRRGYTLVELLIVITILGILGTMVIPSFGSTNVLRTQAAVRTVVADITFAQSDALSYQEQRAVMFDEDANMYTLVEVNGSTLDADADALYDPHGIDQRYRVDLDEMDFGGAFMENVSFNGGSNLIFDEIGGPVPAAGATGLSTGGSLEIVGPQARYRINVAPFTGRVTVERID
ncbi:MAG: prepilin-type N-terminal cleavage/methylation domain-containing protein [Phycisphaerales bacterium]